MLALLRHAFGITDKLYFSYSNSGVWQNRHDLYLPPSLLLSNTVAIALIVQSPLQVMLAVIFVQVCWCSPFKGLELILSQIGTRKGAERISRKLRQFCIDSRSPFHLLMQGMSCVLGEQCPACSILQPLAAPGLQNLLSLCLLSGRRSQGGSRAP